MKSTDKNTETKAIKINFAAYAVQDKKNGGYDKDATLAKFNQEYLAWEELTSKDQGKLLAAAEAVFAQINDPDVGVKKKALVAKMISSLGEVDILTYVTLEERANDVIDTHARYYSVLGAGGGIKRMTDEQYAHFQTTGQNPVDVAAAAKKAKAEEKQTPTA